MKLIRLDSEQRLEGVVATVGTFDGLHVGHRAVVGTVQSEAGAEGTSVVVTFDPHPRSVISPDSAPRLLTTLDERADVFARMGVDALAVVEFTQDLRALSPEQFVDKYLLGFLKVDMLVVGYDHGFGRDRAGDIETIRALGEARGFSVSSVEPTLIDGDPVSSTRVRRHIELGEMEAAGRLLGAGYPVSGEVVRGDERGRAIGFPTANLEVGETKLLPPNGVYAGEARMEDGSVGIGVCNLGTKPTFGRNDRTLEVHILDFNREIYGERLTVELSFRLRPEREFETVEDLKTQINQDIVEARGRLDGASIPMDAHNRSTDGG